MARSKRRINSAADSQSSRKGISTTTRMGKLCIFSDASNVYDYRLVNRSHATLTGLAIASRAGSTRTKPRSVAALAAVAG